MLRQSECTMKLKEFKKNFKTCQAISFNIRHIIAYLLQKKSRHQCPFNQKQLCQHQKLAKIHTFSIKENNVSTICKAAAFVIKINTACGKHLSANKKNSNKQKELTKSAPFRNICGQV